MKIKLLVIRTQNPEKLADFYSLLGLTFEYHKHGNSPYHYSAMIDGLVFEIYPLTKNQTEADKYLRLGFELPDFEKILAVLQNNGIAYEEPELTDFGTLTIISDPDGRKIELYKAD